MTPISLQPASDTSRKRNGFLTALSERNPLNKAFLKCSTDAITYNSSQAHPRPREFLNAHFGILVTT